MKNKSYEKMGFIGWLLCTVVSEEYHQGCYMKRNAYMVSISDMVIAVYDGRKTAELSLQ